MNRVITQGVSILTAIVFTAGVSEAKGEDGIQSFPAAHGFGGLTEMVDLTKLEGFDKVRTSKDLAKFASEVPGAVGYTAHPAFENGKCCRYAHAVLWYTKLAPTTDSWALFLFDEKEATRKPGEAATDAALAAAESKVSSRLDIARNRIDEDGQSGVILSGDFDEQEVVARAVLRLGGTFRHTGNFGTDCAGCRSVVPGGTPGHCGWGILYKKEHWNCCGSLKKEGPCCYWELLLAIENAEQSGDGDGE